ncbi:MAG: single-stranded DNA-binding protein [Bifidobacteriaceae bacterium]|jgi:single-stranded DNA-binding protein|nr:single-stranded DNA-binding protein [Bifidobacteriaceae bacterium]
MPITTKTSMSGFVASTPRLTRTETGEARLYMKVGQEHFTRQPDGSYTQDDTTFHDLAVYRRSAERAAARFAKGDKFIAEGHIRAYTVTGADGQATQAEEFVARRIGHDAAVTDYQVDRRPRQTRTQQAEVPARQTGPAGRETRTAQSGGFPAGLNALPPASAPTSAAIGM